MHFLMPELSRFMGMVIKMIFFDDDRHHKPHVHVFYGDFKASVAIDGELLAGKLPDKQASHSMALYPRG